MLETEAKWGGDTTDETLVAKVRAGDNSYYDVLVIRYSGRMRRAALRVLPNQADVDEVIQEAHCRAFCCIHQFAGRSSISTWLTQIAVHVALGRRRQKWYGLESIQGLGGSDPLDGIHSTLHNPEQQLRSKETMEMIKAAVWSLPEHYRAVFVLRSVQELSTAEVALLLRISEGCTRTRLHRAKGLLEMKLFEYWNPQRASATQHGEREQQTTSQ